MCSTPFSAIINPRNRLVVGIAQNTTTFTTKWEKVVPSYAIYCLPCMDWQNPGTGINSAQFGIFRHRREFRVHDQNTIYLPRHYGVREPGEAHKLGTIETNVQEKTPVLLLSARYSSLLEEDNYILRMLNNAGKTLQIRKEKRIFWGAFIMK